MVDGFPLREHEREVLFATKKKSLLGSLNFFLPTKRLKRTAELGFVLIFAEVKVNSPTWIQM